MKHDNLLRSEAAALLAQGHRWTVTYCSGADQPRSSGAGLTDFPTEVLHRVPTPAAKRKMVRGQAAKTYFYVSLGEDAAGSTLHFDEG